MATSARAVHRDKLRLETLGLSKIRKMWFLTVCSFFWFLVATQFQGVFNENGLKILVAFITLATVAHQASRERLVLIVGTLFSLPIILFSRTRGFLAHPKYSTRAL